MPPGEAPEILGHTLGHTFGESWGMNSTLSEEEQGFVAPCVPQALGFEPHQPPQYLEPSIHAAFKLVWVHDVGALIKPLGVILEAFFVCRIELKCRVGQSNGHSSFKSQLH